MLPATLISVSIEARSVSGDGADLALGAGELGSTLLGGLTFSELARAGRVLQVPRPVLARQLVPTQRRGAAAVAAVAARRRPSSRRRPMPSASGASPCR